MAFVPDITITSLETITAYSLTGDYRFTLDELQKGTIANTQDKQDITGKMGRKLSSIKKNKGVTVSGDNGMVSGGLMAAQVGNQFVEGATEVLFTDYLVVKGNKATTSYKAVGTAGNEIATIYVRNDSGTIGKSYTQDATAKTGKFAYAPDTKEISFNTGEVADGTEIVVSYKRKVEAFVLENAADHYSEKLMLYVDAMGEDKCGNVYRVQFYLPKADFNGEFSLEMGDNQTIHSFEAESLVGAGCAGVGSNLWTYTIFANDAEDAQ